MKSTRWAVFNKSKIQIWERITTIFVIHGYCVMLYLISQRYKFESESQPWRRNSFAIAAVFNKSKIQIWERITTTKPCEAPEGRLYLISQRYKFESESQLSIVTSFADSAVFNKSKIQIWERITTGIALSRTYSLLYLISQRYKFESESQLETFHGERYLRCI